MLPIMKMSQAIHLTEVMQSRDTIFALGIFPDANWMKRHDRVPAVGCLTIELSDIQNTA